MILPSLILVLLIGGLVAWAAGHYKASAARWVALTSLGVDAALLVGAYGPLLQSASPSMPWIDRFSVPWIPDLGIRLSLSIDGLSFWLLGLTMFLGMVSVVVSWNEITRRVGFFHFNLLWILAGITGVFLAADLFLFYFLWELMLVPMYFLIAIWGHEQRTYASIKFFIFTQLSGLFLLLAILGLYFAHASETGVYTFSREALLETTLDPRLAKLLMMGFLAAFLVKLPAVPFHTWLPDAHTQAPTAGSVILAGLMLKTGAYGLLRFVVPFFPEALPTFRYGLLVLGAVGILYGALQAFGQRDLKRLVAYTSVSHMGFVLVGVFAGNRLALDGVLVQMLAHGISTGALFVVAGLLQERLQTRDMEQMGGLWALAPRMGAVSMVFAVASLGLPGLGNFVGEFLILLGTWSTAPVIAALGACGLVGATIYALSLMQRVFQGRVRDDVSIADLSLRESAVMASLIIVIVWLGLFPSTVLRTAEPALQPQTGTIAMASTESSWASQGSRRNP